MFNKVKHKKIQGTKEYKEGWKDFESKEKKALLIKEAYYEKQMNIQEIKKRVKFDFPYILGILEAAKEQNPELEIGGKR